MRCNSTPSVIEAQRTSSESSSRIEIEQLKQVIRLLGAELKTARALQAKPSKECENLKKQLYTLELENKKLVEQCSRLQQQLALVPKTSTSVLPQVDNNQQVASLALQLSKTQEELLSLIAEKSALLESKKEVDESLWKTAHELKTLQGQLLFYSQRDESLQKEKNQYQEKTEQIQQQLGALEKELFSEKAALISLTKEHSSLGEQLTTTLQEYASLEKVSLNLKTELFTKTTLQEETVKSLKELETKHLQLIQEHESAEKRCKETDELLVLKLRTITELEEEIQTFQSTVTTLQEKNRELLASKNELEILVQNAQKSAHTATEQMNNTMKELEGYKHKLTISLHKLQQLEGWKRKIEPSLIQIKSSLESLSNASPPSKHEESSFSETKYDMPEEFSSHKPRSESRPPRHDSLF